MDRKCTRCDLPSPAHARFCTGCGSALPRARRSRTSSPVANVALVFAVLVSLAAASKALEPLQHSWQPPGGVARFDWDDSFRTGLPPSGRGEDRTVHRDYALCEDKAKVMFDLLAPSDVGVVVSRRGGEVHIKGTPWEVAALDRFAELITRKQHQNKGDVGAYIDRIFKTSKTVEDYRLPGARRETLHSILAFDDVPVRVGFESGQRVTVQATAEDQETVRSFVEIVRGSRRACKCSGIRCWLGWHSRACRPYRREALLEAKAALHDAGLETSGIIRDGFWKAESILDEIEMPLLSLEPVDGPVPYPGRIEISVPPERSHKLERLRHQRDPNHPHDCPGCE